MLDLSAHGGHTVEFESLHAYVSLRANVNTDEPRSSLGRRGVVVVDLVVAR